MAGTAGILEGITGVDLSRPIAGAYSAMALADPGACVVKVEASAGDDGRRRGSPLYDGSSITFMSCNRGKESLAPGQRYATNAGRMDHRPEMATELNAIFAEQLAARWVAAFPLHRASGAARSAVDPVPGASGARHGELGPDGAAAPGRSAQLGTAARAGLRCRQSETADAQRAVRLADPPS